MSDPRETLAAVIFDALNETNPLYYDDAADELATAIIARWLPGALADERVVEAAMDAIYGALLPPSGRDIAHDTTSAALTAAVTALTEETA